MLRFSKIRIRKEEFYAAKNPTKIWDVNDDNVVISKSIKTQKGFNI